MRAGLLLSPTERGVLFTYNGDCLSRIGHEGAILELDARNNSLHNSGFELEMMFEVSGDQAQEHNARFHLTVLIEKADKPLYEVVFNKYGQDSFVIPTGWASYYLKIDSNCKWKITVTAPA